MRFERVAKLDELRILLGHLGLEIDDRFRRADAGNDIFALRVRQVLAEHLVLARARVARKADARGAVVALVAEHHRAHVDGGAVRHVRRDIELPTVVDRALAHPRTENRFDGQLQLFDNVFGEVPACLIAHDAEEQVADLLEVVGFESDVRLHANTLLDRVKVNIEVLVVDAESDLAEQLDEATVGVVGEALVARLLDQALQGLGVEAEVEDRIHHARHGERRTGANGNQQRVGALAEGFACFLLERCELLAHLGHQHLGKRIAVEVFEAGFGRDDEARGDVDADLRHLAQIGALAAQQLLVMAVAFSEGIYEFTHD